MIADESERFVSVAGRPALDVPLTYRSERGGMLYSNVVCRRRSP
jgi:hypothetical protein